DGQPFTVNVNQDMTDSHIKVAFSTKRDPDHAVTFASRTRRLTKLSVRRVTTAWGDTGVDFPRRTQWMLHPPAPCAALGLNLPTRRGSKTKEMAGATRTAIVRQRRAECGLSRPP